MSKYDPLHTYLTSKVEITLTYEEIERILGFRLPDSAYEYPEWWDNRTDNHPQKHAWYNAGWEVINKQLGKSITFRKFEFQ